jgi:hypothetical protein
MNESEIFTSRLVAYFGAEKFGGLIAFLIGVSALAFSFYLYRYGSTYRGMIYPLVLFGLIEVGVGGGLFLKSDKDVSRLLPLYSHSAQEFKSLEGPRMETVMQRFKMIKGVWLILLLGSAMFSFYFFKNDLVFSVCLGIILQVSVLLVFDMVAEKRADQYLQSIAQLRSV